MARKYVNPGRRDGFAAAFAELSPAKQKQVIDDFRAAMLEVFGSVKDAPQQRQLSGTTAGGAHPPFTGTHAHGHSDYAGGEHSHLHTHSGDADHEHEHTASQEQAARSRRQYGERQPDRAAFQQRRVFNSAGRDDDAWARLAAIARELGTNRKG